MMSISIAGLYILYIIDLKGFIHTGIPLLIDCYLKDVYVLFESLKYQLPSDSSEFPDFPIILTFGFVLNREDVKALIDVVIKYPRVSSQPQEQGHSLYNQDARLEDESDKLNLDETILIGGEWESASTMLRENIEEIVELVRNDDRTYCLMLRSVDRLSRADPLEACVFLWIMKRNDVILYIDDFGYFDLESLDQQMIVIHALIYSRRQYQQIKENTAEGRKTTLKSGGYPFPTPFGYETEESDDVEKLVRSDDEAELLRRAAELTLHGDEENDINPGNLRQVREYLERQYRDSEISVPHKTSLRYMLQNRTYTGKLIYDGETRGTCPEIIPEDMFNEIQEILNERGYNSEDQEIDHVLLKVVEKFGVEASLDMFEDLIKGRCPRCGDDVQKWGSTQRFGRRVNRYRCVNHPDTFRKDDDVDEDATCDFLGPLLSSKFLRKWEGTVPLTCPVCQRYLSEDDWERDPAKINGIQQTCDNCECQTSVNLSKNKFKRAKQVTEVLRFFDSQDTDNSGSNQRKSSTNSGDGDPSDDGENATLAQFQKCAE